MYTHVWVPIKKYYSNKCKKRRVKNINYNRYISIKHKF